MTIYWIPDGTAAASRLSTPPDGWVEVKPGDVFRFDGEADQRTVLDTDPAYIYAENPITGQRGPHHPSRCSRVTETTGTLYWRGPDEDGDGHSASIFDRDDVTCSPRERIKRGDPCTVNHVGTYTVLDVGDDRGGREVTVRNEDNGTTRRVGYGLVRFRPPSRVRDTEVATPDEVNILDNLRDHAGRVAVFTIDRNVMVDAVGQVGVGCQTSDVLSILNMGGAISKRDGANTLILPGTITLRGVRFGNRREVSHSEVRGYASKALLVESPPAEYVNCGLGFFICATHDHHIFVLDSADAEPIIRQTGAGTIGPVRHGFDEYPECRPEHHSTFDGSNLASLFVLVKALPEQFPGVDRVTKS